MDDVSHGSERSTRRTLLKSGLAAAAAAATAAVTATPRVAGAREELAPARPMTYVPEALGEPVEFLGLRPGVELGAWTVVEVRSNAQSIALILQDRDGQTYQLDVLARDEENPGVAQSERYSVFLVNGGDGSMRSDEERARGALAVGHYLRWAEQHIGSGPELLTLAERQRQHPFGSFRIA